MILEMEGAAAFYFERHVWPARGTQDTAAYQEAPLWGQLGRAPSLPPPVGLSIEIPQLRVEFDSLMGTCT